ncbi:MAG TPA: thiamine-binding protein [Acidimicrobiales bacterium]|jgi:uncharacterized protein YqgV (UPF0045/DUF77 family)
MGKVRLEFTVEPFEEGRPGPHVTAAVDAVASRGLAVDMGPFSTCADADVDAAPEAVASLLRAAFDQGASRVSLQVTRLDDEAAT